jgi:hypothetical protein
MNRFVYFMAVGLAFTVLQVATVEAVPATTGDDTHTGGAQNCADARDADGNKSPDAVAACWAATETHAISATQGFAPGTQECRDATGTVMPCTTAGDGGVALTIGDPRCAVGLAPGTRDPGCPNYRP